MTWEEEKMCILEPAEWWEPFHPHLVNNTFVLPKAPATCVPILQTRFPTLNKQTVQIYTIFFPFTISNKEPYVFQVKNQKQFSETRGLHYAGMPYLLGGQQFKSDAYLS